MMQCKVRKEFFKALTRIELHLWRQDIDPPNWLTETWSKGGDQRLTLTRSKNELNENFHKIQSKRNFHTIQSNKTLL